MGHNEILTQVDKLALSEKILLVEDIWDSIARAHADIPLPEWQKQELDRRYAEYKAGKLALYDWQEVHEALRNSAR